MSKMYRCMRADTNKLVVLSKSDCVLFEISPNPRKSEYIFLGADDVRKIRDQLNEFLDEPSPPVGTIVCGTGLTNEQKKSPPDAKRLRAIADLLARNDTTWLWRDTAEGHYFWGTIERRLLEMAHCSDHEISGQPINVWGATVKPGTLSDGKPGLSVSIGTNTQLLNPTAARLLAAALTKHADRAEKK